VVLGFLKRFQKRDGCTGEKKKLASLRGLGEKCFQNVKIPLLGDST